MINMLVGFELKMAKRVPQGSHIYSYLRKVSNN